MRFVTLRFIMMRGERALRRAGCASVHRFAVVPDLSNPVLAYELGSAAAEYASTHLVLHSPIGSRLLRKLVVTTFGCDLHAGAVLLIGPKP